MFSVLLQEKATCMCPTCVNILAWIGPYPSLFGGQKSWVQGCCIDSGVVWHTCRFTLVLVIKITVAGYSLSVSAYIFMHLSFTVSWSICDCGTFQACRSWAINLSFVHQLICYHLKRSSKPLICIYTSNGCIALASEIHLYSRKRQDVAIEAGIAMRLSESFCMYQQENFVRGLKNDY